MVEDAFQDFDMSEGDLLVAPRLLEIIMQRCRGRVDGCIPLYMRMTLQRCRHLSLRARCLPHAPFSNHV